MPRQSTVLFYGAAASTAIAGLLHLVVASDAVRFNEMTLAILFTVAGVVQVFYAVPIVRRWGRPRYYAGIIGGGRGLQCSLILWRGTRIPSGRVCGGYTELLPINAVGIAVLALQFAALLLAIRILQTATNPSKTPKEESWYGAVAE